jgi:hypothetical protein
VMLVWARMAAGERRRAVRAMNGRMAWPPVSAGYAGVRVSGKRVLVKVSDFPYAVRWLEVNFHE